jgi:regulator of protease activity HflC (stomatin/prohibitin superfamily)
MFGLAALIVVILVVVMTIANTVKVIGQAEVMVIERWGRFNRIARSGLNVLIPYMEKGKTIDVRYFEADPGGVKRVTSGSTSRIDLREQV